MDQRDLQLDLQRQALVDTRARIAAMEALLQELPEIFEARFRERLQPLLDQQQQLLSSNADLRQQLVLQQSAAAPSQRRLQLLPLPGRRRLKPGALDTGGGNPADAVNDGDAPPTAASAGPTHR